jgi:hypothetical protein
MLFLIFLENVQQDSMMRERGRPPYRDLQEVAKKKKC